MKCNIFKMMILALLSICFLTGCAFKADLSPVDSTDSNMQLFEVENGSNVKTVSKQLESEGLIRNGKDFLRYAKKNNLTNIKAGKYNLSKAMSSQEILDIMVNGKIYIGEKIIVPEGFEISQIAERLATNGIVDKDKFLDLASQPELFEEKYSFLRGMTQENLEGYLYPNTYFFEKNSSEEKVISTMLDEFDKLYHAEFQPLLKDSELTVQEAVILGSIIEKEAILEKDRPLVSSVFYNRLKKGMRLQSDATVQYVLKERKDKVLYEDLKIESPYNTYHVKGLPIGAICNPGKSSIIAALKPVDTDYLFFLTKNDGSKEQVYAKAYEEHLQNKKKYLD